MYIMGENPMISDPNTTHVEQAFRQLDFMVVQDIFLTDTAQLAHIVLPAAASLEKDGSFTNTERRVQLIQPVLPPPAKQNLIGRSSTKSLFVTTRRWDWIDQNQPGISHQLLPLWRS